jgi:hypothetical protein
VTLVLTGRPDPQGLDKQDVDLSSCAKRCNFKATAAGPEARRSPRQ